MRLVNTRVALLSFALGASLCAQSVATGAPPFATMRSVPEGQIDLANLNVQTVIPIVHKAGVGVPFSYALVDNSAVWTPASGGWQLASNLGWNVATNLLTGYETYQATPGQCGSGYPTQMYNFTIYAGFEYTDQFGVQHSFPLVIQYPTGNPCGPQNPSSGSAAATDGSGYTLTASTYGGAPTVSLASGSGQSVVAPLFLAGSTITSGAGSITDPNGNKISADGNGNFYDTLGQKALTVGGAQSPNSSMTLTYATSSGGSAQVVVHFGSYSVRTNFGCPGIAEYSAGSVPLVTEIDLPDSTKYMVSYEATPGFGGDVTGRVASVQLPTGGIISYQYTGGSNGITCGDGSTATLTRTTPDGTWTYQHTESGTAWTTLVTDPLGNQTNYQFQGIYQTERDAYSGAVGGQLLQTVYTCYNNAAPPCNATSVVLPITQRSTTTKLDNSLESKTAATYNGYGLLLETDRYDFGNGAPGALTRKTIIAYATLSGIYDHPASIEVDNGAGAKKAYTSFAYDTKGNTTSMSRWVAGTTNLTTNFTVNANGTVATATDANGAVTSYSYTGSSCNGAFPTAISLPGNLSTSAAWNCYVALPASRTDANGQTTSFAFNDPFARLTSISNPDGGVTNFTYTAASGSAPATSEGAMVFNNGASTVDTLTTLDSLGRPHIEQRRQGPGSANFDSVETDYDADGRAYHVSQPYQGTAGQAAPVGTAFTTTNFDGLNRPSEITDGGNGTLSYAYPGNDVLTTLGPAPTGENTKRRQFEYDGLGELTSVCELTGASGAGTCGQSTTPQPTGFWTRYTYNTLGQIVSVAQNAQSGSPQTRSFAFDALGRLTSETNPESGTTTYTFDTDSTCGTSNGDLVKRVDAMSNVTCYAHDALHRVTAVTYPSGPYSSATAAKTFIFDAATVDGVAMPNAKGRLAEAFTGPASGKITDEGFGYDAMGRVTTNPQCAPATSGCVWYPMTYTYDQAGDLTGDSTDLTYGRDAEGRISSVTSNYVDGYHDADILTSPSYNAAGDLTSALLANGTIAETRCYDVMGRVTGIAAASGGAPPACGAAGLIYGETLTYNPDGSVAAINDTVNGDWTYQHDDLGRLSASACSSHCPDGTNAQAFQYTYDAFGNRTAQTVTAGTGPQPQYTFQNNRIATVTYDADGNLLGDGLHTYTYDADGHMLAVDGSRLYTYGAFGRRVEHTAEYAYGQPATDLVYDLAGHVAAEHVIASGGFIHQEIYAGSLHVASYSDYMYFDFDSALGTGRYRQSINGPAPESCESLPFGDALSCQDPDTDGWTDDSPMHFAGSEHDSESNLEHFWFRQYSNTQGRWLSPDPAGLAAANPADPQSWNKYAYVENQPLSATDPLGEFMVMDTDPGDPCAYISDEGDASCEEPPGLWPDGTPVFPDVGVGVGASGGDGGVGGGGAAQGGATTTYPSGHGVVVAQSTFPGGDTISLTPNPFLLATLPSTTCDFGPCNSLVPGVVAAEAGEAVGGVACFGVGICETALAVVGVAAAVAAVGVAGYKLYSNITENEKFDYSVSQIEKRCGRKLSRADRRRLHDEISKLGFDPSEIIEIGVGMFCPGK